MTLRGATCHAHPVAGAHVGRRNGVSRFVPTERLPVLNQLPSLLGQTVDASVRDDRGLLMSIVVWLVVGLVAGFLASKVVNKRGKGIVLDIVLGLIGSFVGGFLIHLMGFHRDGSIVWSIVVA